MSTNKNLTNYILGGYLMNNNELNVDYVTHLVEVTALNTQSLYNERFNTRRKIRNIAINELMYFINLELTYAGYKNMYATNKQVMDFDRQHNNGLEKVLDNLVISIENTRKEQ